MGLVDTIRENYPQYAWALNDPELGPLLKKAVDPAQPFSPTRFNASLMATSYWRKRSASQRQWDITRNSDPGSANAARGEFRTELQRMAKRLGVHLSANEMIYMTESYVAQGIAPDDPRVIAALGGMYARKKGKGGEFGAAETTVRNMANNDYMVAVTPHWVQTYGRRLITGHTTEDVVREELSRKAASQYQHLASELRSGITMKELFDGHVATLAEELELDPETINLRDAKWRKILDTVDPKSGSHRAATLSEVQQMARSRDEFWKTSKGKEMGSGLSTYLLEAFGAR